MAFKSVWGFDPDELLRAQNGECALVETVAGRHAGFSEKKGAPRDFRTLQAALPQNCSTDKIRPPLTVRKWHWRGNLPARTGWQFRRCMVRDWPYLGRVRRHRRWARGGCVCTPSNRLERKVS